MLAAVLALVGALTSTYDLDQKKPLRNLQGTWKVVKVEFDGKDLDKAVFAGTKLIVRGSRLILVEKGAMEEIGNLLIASSKKPRWLDTNVTAGINRGKKSFGIFNLEGKHLRLCQRVPGSDRPLAFSSKDQTSLMYLEREDP